MFPLGHSVSDVQRPGTPSTQSPILMGECQDADLFIVVILSKQNGVKNQERTQSWRIELRHGQVWPFKRKRELQQASPKDSKSRITLERSSNNQNLNLWEEIRFLNPNQFERKAQSGDITDPLCSNRTDPQEGTPAAIYSALSLR